ncbi:hypothetical protein JCM19992_04040 [Thermostilla marina]
MPPSTPAAERSVSPIDLFSDTWAAADGSGRRLPEAGHVRKPQPDKIVAMFYFLWQGGRHPTLYDISRIVADPEKPWGPRGAFHFWAEPALGYYRTEDPYVIRKHAEMLAIAGVDVIVFDVTNGLTYDPVWQALCDEFTRLRRLGWNTPKIAFLGHSHSERVVQHLYEVLYKPGRYRELWFTWQGKPLVMSSTAGLPEETAAFFTFRESWAWTTPRGWFGDGRNKWPWLDHYPQRFGWSSTPDTPEQIAVCAAQHPISTIGRSFHDGAEPPEAERRPEAGWCFAEQWRRAHEVDPPVVFITGWNEWIAQRFLKEPNKAPSQLAGKPLAVGDTYFVDQYDAEFSRDIEPARNLPWDNFYWQLVAEIRRFKGVRPVEPIPQADIAIDGRFDDWRAVAPEYRDFRGDPARRDFPGWGETHYRDTSGRNDIVVAKAARCERGVAFFVETAPPLQLPEDGRFDDWMVLRIDADDDPTTGPLGCEICIRRRDARPQAVIEYCRVRNTGVDPQSSEGAFAVRSGMTPVERRVLGTVPLGVGESGLELVVPWKYLAPAASDRGDTDVSADARPRRILFQWSDGIPPDGDWRSYLYSGDAAPLGRFRYVAEMPASDR